MNNVLEEVDRRANLALSNQMEMLIFYLADNQLYGINVFKIIEILECPKTMTKMPLANEAVCGTVDFRGNPVTVIDLGFVLGLPRIDYSAQICYIVICDYNNSINGFLIVNPDSLINRSWEDIKSPSGLLTKSAYLTAIAYTDNNEAIQILDIEKVLAEIIGIDDTLSKEFIPSQDEISKVRHNVLVIDDSKTARQLMETVLNQMGIGSTAFDSALSAMDMFQQKLSAGEDLRGLYGLIICDIEMPGMDGFTFVRKMRENPATADIKIILHSSLSNPSNKLKAELVGATDFVAKFRPDELAKRVLYHLGLS